MQSEIKIGDIVEAEVTKITEFGAFAKINGQALGLVHISQISDSFVKDVNEHLKLGDKIKARVIKLGPGKKIDLSLREQPKEVKPAYVQGPGKARPFHQERGRTFGLGQRNYSGFKSSDFEEKLRKFLQDSQQNMTQLKKHNEKYYR